MATRRLSELDRFLSAPALPPRALARGGGGWTNNDIVVAVCGAKGIFARDEALYDAVALKYERAVDTFAKAFAVCLRGRRSLSNMDIETLRECHPAFVALQLPERIEEMQIAAEIGEWFERQAGERANDVDEEAIVPETPATAPATRAPAPPRTRVAELEAELSRIRAQRTDVLRQLAAAAEEARRAKYLRDLQQHLTKRCRKRLKMAASGRS